MMKKILFCGAIVLTALPAFADTDGHVFFHTPSEKILCMANRNSGELSCMTTFATPKIRARHHYDCPLDEFDEFILPAKGKARYSMMCRGDVSPQQAGNFPMGDDGNPIPANTVLPYGKSISGKTWTCTSTASGLRCRSRNGQHGFDLNRSVQKLF